MLEGHGRHAFALVLVRTVEFSVPICKQCAVNSLEERSCPSAARSCHARLTASAPCVVAS
eukprot:4403416-Alexandrium_andersonii.AAC.1